MFLLNNGKIEFEKSPFFIFGGIWFFDGLLCSFKLGDFGLTISALTSTSVFSVE